LFKIPEESIFIPTADGTCKCAFIRSQFLGDMTLPGICKMLYITVFLVPFEATEAMYFCEYVWQRALSSAVKNADTEHYDFPLSMSKSTKYLLWKM
jgi:hypothetical protein